MQPPKISVITVSMNQGEFIRDNIESVLRQNYPNFEHIVIDGGSTDNTLDVLRSYPHLQWISEKDRNQSHALNKGFSKASGDIIAWLNSDDWYADGAFHAVAQALETHPVILTGADETDRQGKWKQSVPNIERSFHDLLRYWVPYAWLAQNGVFFKRSLLEEVRYGPGYYVEEDLHYCMDYDLWLRMAQRVPFTHRLNKTCAYFRIYDENKTAQSPLSVQKEFGRVYRRHLNRLCKAERRLAFILPFNQLTRELAATADAIMQQSLHDFDLIFVDYCSEDVDRATVRQFYLAIERATNIMGVRCVTCRGQSPLQAAAEGMKTANAPLLALVWPGDALPVDYAATAVDTFALDPMGIALPLKNDPGAVEALSDKQTYRLRFTALLSSLFIPLNFVARKEALEELDYFRSWQQPPVAMRELILRILFKGWAVNVDHLTIQPNQNLYKGYREELNGNSNTMSARLLTSLADEFSKDAFAAIRAQHSWMPVLNPETIEMARKCLAQSSAG